MMEDNIREKVLDAVRDLRKEIIGRGGDISPLAGLKDFPSAIYNIPADNAITTITQEEVSQFKKVPENSTGYGYIAEFGGMTYRDAETNTLRNTKPTEIVSKGVNLYSGSEEFVLDGTQKNITIPIVGAENISTFSFTRDGTRVNSSTLFRLVYEDGTVFGIAPGVSSGVETIKYTAKSKVTAIKLFNWCGFTGRVYDIQLENGSAATKYKPYVGTLATKPIPEEIQALEGFGEGINVKYYNKVDIVNRKYKRVIDTFTFDGLDDGSGSKIGTEKQGTYGWQEAHNLLNARGYVRKWIGDLNTYPNDIVVCDKLDYANVGSSTTGIGVDVINSSAGDGAPASFIAIRPPLVDGKRITNIYEFVEWLKANPITVKVARKVPIETDLPVYMSPLIGVEGGGTVEFVNEYGYAVPSKIVYQTKQSEVI